eukprot:1853781-Prymnesium_polylepis.1
MLQTARRLLLQMQPKMQLEYSNVETAGEYPLGASSTISKLAALDQQRLHAFVASCRNHSIPQTLVTSISHLATFQELTDVKQEQVSFAAGLADAFLFPCSEDGFAQMSAQFRPLVIANNNRRLTFLLSCQNKQKRHLQVACSDIYNAFDARCARIKHYAHIIRE